MMRFCTPRALLPALCAVAILARIVTSALLPNIAHPDETFQYLEQAYRLSTGHGLVPWEYVVGARSWLLAGLITPVMKVGVTLSAAPAIHLWAVTLFLIALATLGVVAAFILGWRTGGVSAAFFAGLLAASWCELVYLSPHVLADTISAIPLIWALAASYRVDAPRFRRMVLAGTLFGLAFVFRIQLAPAIALAMFGVCGLELRARYIPMAIGFLGPLILLGATDWLTLGAPFRSVLVYLRVNGGGVADTFGTVPALGYVATEIGLWGAATPLILVSAAYGARKLPLVAIVAGVILASFSLVGHKEYRFIYPALPLLFVLCGVGTADLVGRLSGARPLVGRVVAALVWLVASAATGAQAPMQQKWHQEVAWLEGFQRVNADPAACGIGINPPDLWFLTGKVRLRQDIGLYDGSMLGAQTGAYNYRFVVDPKTGVSNDSGFQPLTCSGSPQKLCIYKRPGGCTQGRPLLADPGDDVRRVLDRLGLSAP